VLGTTAVGQWGPVTPPGFWRGTKAEYDAIPVKDPTLLYVITDESGSAWMTEGAADARYVNVSGDTMTGGLIVKPPTNPAEVKLDGNPSATVTRKVLTFATDGVRRWTLLADAPGDSLYLSGYNDSGSASTPIAALTVDRATNLAQVAGDPVHVRGIATKQYVDDVGKWQVYTPTFAGATTSAVTARYVRIGNTVHVRIYAVISAVTAAVTVTLPVAAHAGGGDMTPGQAIYRTSSFATYTGFTMIDRGSNFMRLYSPSGANGLGSQVASNMPFAWTSGSYIQLMCTYEAA
jgi:hypothetical protein